MLQLPDATASAAAIGLGPARGRCDRGETKLSRAAGSSSVLESERARGLLIDGHLSAFAAAHPPARASLKGHPLRVWGQTQRWRIIFFGMGIAAAIETAAAAATAAAPPPHRRTAGGPRVGAFFCAMWRSLFGQRLLVFWTLVLIFGAFAAYGGWCEQWARFRALASPSVPSDLRDTVILHVVR